MSVATATKTSATVAAGSRGYAEYDRHYSDYSAQKMSAMTSESGRRIGIQDLIEPVRSLNPSSIEQFHHLNRHSPTELGQNQYNRYSPPQLPLPLSKQSQSQSQPQSQQHLISSSHMELESYKLLTPITPMTSPTPTTSSSPSLAPMQSYSPTNSVASTPSITSKSDDQNSYMTTIQASGMIMPLSLQERRERNKIASAKYRAKKHRQNQEMSTTIAELTAENNVLLRQVDEIKIENLELKELVDKLKSKLVEGKILKRLGRGGTKLTLSPASTVDDDLEISPNVSAIRKNSTKRGGFSGHAKGTGPSTKSARK